MALRPSTLVITLGLVLVPLSAAAQFVPKTFTCNETADALAGYVGQSNCYNNPQPGVAEFRTMVLDAFPSTGDLGIMRACNSGGKSEHKEGRAWDWWVVASVPAEKAIADGFLAALLETDDCGQPYALARRFGIMYMIWNKKIWKSYKASQGWVAYTGPNPHTDHVHFSFSWPGALQETSWWTEGAAPPPGEEAQPACSPGAVAGAENEPFKDMPPGAFAYDEALAMLNLGITNGCSNDPKLFCPNCPTSRYQAVVFLLRAAGVDISAPPATATFTDVPTSVWYFPYVEKAVEMGLTSGCGADTFCPNAPTTRAQMAKFINGAAGFTKVTPATATFGDVPTGHLFFSEVETIKAMCVTNGCNSDGTAFCPDDNLTRAQAAIFVARAFDIDNANSCIDYCDPSTCPEGDACDAWGPCGGFDGMCDDTGTQTRTCHTYSACSATSLDPTCGEQSNVETQACTRTLPPECTPTPDAGPEPLPEAAPDAPSDAVAEGVADVDDGGPSPDDVGATDAASDVAGDLDADSAGGTPEPDVGTGAPGAGTDSGCRAAENTGGAPLLVLLLGMALLLARRRWPRAG